MDTAQIDTAIATLQDNKTTWAQMPVADRNAYVRGIRAHTAEVAREWVEAAVKAKGLSMESPLAGEEWTSGPFAVMALLNDLEVTLDRIADGISPIEGYPVRQTPSGQVIVDVFPTSAEDRVLFSGISAEVWMDPSLSPNDLEDTVATFYSQDSPEGAVQVVLAAGNIASIAPLDVIYAMFNEGKVVVVKMNPVNDYLGAYLERIFSDLIADGFLRFAYGDADVGAYLTGHDGVDSIHITGSASTHDAIVFGSGDEGAANKQNNAPINMRPVASELGGVSPTIIVPGSWSRRDIRHQAEHVVSQKMHNSGFNCVAAQLVVVPADWEHTEVFLSDVRELLREMDDRDPYYPGAMDRCEAVVDRTSDVEVHGDVEPRYLITDLDPLDVDEPMFTTEVFGPVLGVVRLPSPDVPSYLIKATSFANDRLYGTLGVNILAHPRTMRKQRSAFGRMLASLDYGTIAVNSWTGGAYFMPKLTWGAAPGHTAQDIQSGRGFVHNVLMFDKAEKSIIYGPFVDGKRAWLKGEFHVAPKPVYFMTNDQAHIVGERLIHYAMTRSKADLAKVASAAVRG
ncbi:MAG: aldehyde dehydrogenase family protein [Acidimicrobiia bacterium]